MKKTPQDYSIPELEAIAIEYEHKALTHTLNPETAHGKVIDSSKASRYMEVARKAREEISRKMGEAMDIFLPSKE